MAGRQCEDAHAAGGKHASTGLVANREHRIGKAAAQRRQVGLRLEAGCVEDDEVRHGVSRQSRVETDEYPSALDATAAGIAAPSCGVTGNTALICPVPDAPKYGVTTSAGAS